MPCVFLDHCTQFIDAHQTNVLNNFNPLKMKRTLIYLKTQFVPRSKHFSSRL